MSRLRRFHINLYIPEWSRGAIQEFTRNLSGKKLMCSYHATKKYERFSRQYQKAIRDLLKSIDLELSVDYIFEFAANNKNQIKKICYRFPMSNLDSDIILVISSTGKVVTIFFNKNFDPHINLDSSVYEKGETENVIRS